MAFHEKAGRSQVDSFVFSLDNVFLSPPSSHCRHASIRTLEERIISLGAYWVFSFQPVLPSVWRPVVLFLESGTWARPLTQSPELGFGLLSFLFLERFCFCFAWRSERVHHNQSLIRILPRQHFRSPSLGLVASF